jgi:hypothetical protein
MSAKLNRTWADDDGVWCERTPGRSHGIKWEEVYAVSGYKLDGITEVYAVICLEFFYGEFMEIDNEMQGFEDVVSAIGERLQGLDRDWFRRIDSLSVHDSPVTVWKTG